MKKWLLKLFFPDKVILLIDANEIMGPQVLEMGDGQTLILAGKLSIKNSQREKSLMDDVKKIINK